MRKRPRSLTFVVALSPAIALALAFAGCASTDPLGSGGAGGELTGVTGSTTSKAASTSASTSSVTTTSTTSSTSTTGATTTSTSTGGPACTDPDPGEPNETLATAYALPPIDDCDSSAAQVSGKLGPGGNDVDWYKYAGSDTSTCVVDPTRQLLGVGMRICKYIQCDNGKTPSFSCPAGTTDDMQDGHPGCCAAGGTSFTLSLTCGSTFFGSDAATVFIRVDHPGGPGCESYKVSYHF
jgi:hypothetical protein